MVTTRPCWSNRVQYTTIVECSSKCVYALLHVKKSTEVLSFVTLFFKLFAMPKVCHIELNDFLLDSAVHRPYVNFAAYISLKLTGEIPFSFFLYNLLYCNRTRVIGSFIYSIVYGNYTSTSAESYC